MGSIPAPQALTKEEFAERIKYLKENGLPLTMKNIDPELCKMVNKSSILSFFLGVSVILLMFSFGLSFLLEVI
jgi:hypothetical protein